MTKQKDSEDKRTAWALFLALHARLLERIEAALAQADLPPLAWYDLLWELDKADGGRLRMHEIAAQVVVTRSNLTRLADRLEDAGLLRREAAEHDRRGAYCVITAAGRQMRAKMWPVYSAKIDELFARHLGVAEAKSLAGMLHRVLNAQTDGEAR